ncbi:calcyon neuron-specific vesicular protein isoform X2 [Austrofundulus limnaeus]|uniref:Calcyon neuron-specific vesicular protein isoform X2 n=1 Tax=Austrofundulus limnaeus TaxID=52670 RepID=A0A2I4BMJ3_AUSLI|nr:PREDICTED: neuron-specific protein family member 2-like isoform X2 [Austrofundulus limnaeus]
MKLRVIPRRDASELLGRMRSPVLRFEGDRRIHTESPGSAASAASDPLHRRPEHTPTAVLGSGAAMVKLGSNLSDKMEKQPSADDGFDNIPLITPLEVSQLQQPFADKVIVKTKTQFQLQQQQKNKLYVPDIKKLNINFYTDVSDKVKQKHCTPAALEMYYTDQQQQQGEPGLPSSTNTGFYASLSHLNHAKRTGPELPSSWLPVISAVKEAEEAKEGSETLKSGPEGQE